MDNNTKQKKGWFKKWWIWVIIVFFLIALAQSIGNNKEVINEKVNDAQSDINDSMSDAKKDIDAIDKDEPEVPTEYKSALTKAKQYSSTMHMSKAGIYAQLTSEYGEKFSAEAAQYAVDNLKADYNANALVKLRNIRRLCQCHQKQFVIN